MPSLAIRISIREGNKPERLLIPELTAISWPGGGLGCNLTRTAKLWEKLS